MRKESVRACILTAQLQIRCYYILSVTLKHYKIVTVFYCLDQILLISSLSLLDTHLNPEGWYAYGDKMPGIHPRRR